MASKAKQAQSDGPYNQVTPAVKAIKAALDDGYKIVASDLNSILGGKPGKPIIETIEAGKQPVCIDLADAFDRFVDAKKLIRLLLPDAATKMPPAPWTLGFVNGKPFVDDEIDAGSREWFIGGVRPSGGRTRLAFLNERQWPEQRWRENIVEPVELLRKKWEKWILTTMGITDRKRGRTPGPTEETKSLWKHIDDVIKRDPAAKPKKMASEWNRRNKNNSKEQKDFENAIAARRLYVAKLTEISNGDPK